MKIKIPKIFILLIFGIALFFMTVISLNWTGNLIKKPNEFVENRTVVTKSDLFYDYKITKYPSKVEIIDLRSGNISNLIGISTDEWIFNFGIIPVGRNYVMKSVFLEGNKEDELEISLIAIGNISDMISFSKNNFYLDGNETVYVFLNVTDNTKLGNYTGEIDIIVKKENFG